MPSFSQPINALPSNKRASQSSAHSGHANPHSHSTLSSLASVTSLAREEEEEEEEEGGGTSLNALMAWSSRAMISEYLGKTWPCENPSMAHPISPSGLLYTSESLLFGDSIFRSAVLKHRRLRDDRGPRGWLQVKHRPRDGQGPRGCEAVLEVDDADQIVIVVVKMVVV
jgi:hypothetical protein